MFDLEKSIADWRKQMLAAGIKAPVPLEELEIHLREEIEQQMKSGLKGQKAFEIATRQMGSASTLKKEFKKTNMKTLNLKVAILAFTALAFLDAVLLTFIFLPAFHGNGALVAVWWIFNAPGMLLAISFQQSFQQSFQHYMNIQLPESSFIYLLICAGVFSAFVWSIVGGFVFRPKKLPESAKS
jgi:hypothetical protein